MQILETPLLSNEQKEIVHALWNKEYPEKLGFKTIAELDIYLATLPNVKYYLLQNEVNKIEGWAMKFSRENEVWFAITIDSKAQGKGKGTFLLNQLKENEEVLNGWVIDHENEVKENGEKYRSPVNFYLKNGFVVYPELRLEIPILSAAKIVWCRK
jgi:GNAT superfamily N-acetyltransferase